MRTHPIEGLLKIALKYRRPISLKTVDAASTMHVQNYRQLQWITLK